MDYSTYAIILLFCVGINIFYLHISTKWIRHSKGAITALSRLITHTHTHTDCMADKVTLDELLNACSYTITKSYNLLVSLINVNTASNKSELV